ncbi:MAG: hypothetical protein HZB19_06425 [Chloroflexi bacterium]|nr:hypothetical protein [Chloroflexota bacterium]
MSAIIPRGNTHKAGLWPVIFILVVLAAILVAIALVTAPRPNPNALAIGGESKADPLNIAIQEPLELDFKSKAEVLQIRSDTVQKYPQLLAREYIPFEAVFGQIVDGLPWWGLAGQIYYGRGLQSIEGESEETRFILNPYLLVAADFYWTDGSMDAVSALSFYCAPRGLYWRPRDAAAEVTYDADCITQPHHAPYFDLIAYNARDFNLNYIYVSYPDSLNLTKSQAPDEPYANPQFIHRGNSCGYPGGCNNMSPQTPEIGRIRIIDFPASLVIWLWKDQPTSIEQPADMTFIIHLK